MNFFNQVYQGKTDWWRYLLTLLLVFFGWQFLGSVPFFLVAWNYAGDSTTFMQGAKDMFTNIGIPSNLYLFVMIMTFAIGLLFLYLGITKVHKQPINATLSGRKKVDWNRFFYAFGLWFVVMIVMTGIDYALNPEHFVWNFKAVPFLVLVMVSFLFIPLQTSFEEILFRGYGLQGLGLVFKNALWPLLITSIGFGLLHSFNPEVDKLGPIVMVYYIGTGFFYGIVTLMDEGTELVLGLHASNNIAAAVLVSLDWTVFQTEALFKDISEPSIGFELYLPVLVIYPLMIWIFSKKYHWSDWKQRLTGKIEAPKEVLIDN